MSHEPRGATKSTYRYNVRMATALTRLGSPRWGNLIWLAMEELVGADWVSFPKQPSGWDHCHYRPTGLGSNPEAGTAFTTSGVTLVLVYTSHIRG